MKRFDEPRMTLVYLSREDIIITSGTCGTKMCYGFTCDECENSTCIVQGPCNQYNCPAVRCPLYED